MLVVTLRENEKVLIGDNVSIMVIEIRGGRSVFVFRHRLTFRFYEKN